MQDIQEPIIESVEEVLPLSRRASLMRFARRISGAQFVRYIVVGVWNTAMGYALFAFFTYLFTKHSVHGYIYAALVSNAIAITIAFFGYKFFVFRTKGNYLGEWFKCFAVYGTGMIPGLVVLSALTRCLQSLIHNHAASLHILLYAVERHLSGRPLTLLQHVATGKAMAGYIAGALLMGTTTVYGFVGHRTFTFRPKKRLRHTP
jgi:putative flippase GtrA